MRPLLAAQIIQFVGIIGKLEDIPIGSGNGLLNHDGETRRWVRLPHPPLSPRRSHSEVGLRRDKSTIINNLCSRIKLIGY